MAKRIKYVFGESVVLGNVEWTWESLKQVCHYEFVLEAKARGIICNKYKVPREILNEWIESENWEYDKKSHWQRPYSYRIDSAVNELLLSTSKLVEIQEEVNDIDFEKDSLLSRIKIEIEVKENEEFKKYKTFILEKYSIIIEDYLDEFSEEKTRYEDEIRYKTKVKSGEILIKYLKEKGKKKENPK